MPEPGDNSGGEQRPGPGPIPERPASPPPFQSPPEREPMTATMLTGVKSAKKAKKGTKVSGLEQTMPKPCSTQPVPVFDDDMDEPAPLSRFYGQSIPQPNDPGPSRSPPRHPFRPFFLANGVQPAIGQSITPGPTSGNRGTIRSWQNDVYNRSPSPPLSR